MKSHHELLNSVLGQSLEDLLEDLLHEALLNPVQRQRHEDLLKISTTKRCFTLSSG